MRRPPSRWSCSDTFGSAGDARSVEGKNVILIDRAHGSKATSRRLRGGRRSCHSRRFRIAPTLGSVPRKIILDCDPGHDDAVAMLLAWGSPEIELVAVTTVAGNQTIEKVTRNALAVAAVLGITGVPFARGAARPLEREPQTAGAIHGEQRTRRPRSSRADNRARCPGCRGPDHRHRHGCRTRRDHAGADRCAHQHCACRAEGAPHRGARPRGRAHGRRRARWQLERGRRVQHRDRSGGGIHRIHARVGR